MPVNKKSIKKLRPATTIEARENQLIALAIDNAEEQLLNHTASSQLITHFLKLGTTKMELEKEKLKNENFLLQTKAKAIADDKANDIDYIKVLEALKNYRGDSIEGQDYV